MMSFALVSVFFMAYILTLVIVPKPRKETTKISLDEGRKKFLKSQVIPSKKSNRRKSSYNNLIQEVTPGKEQSTEEKDELMTSEKLESTDQRLISAAKVGENRSPEPFQEVKEDQIRRGQTTLDFGRVQTLESIQSLD